MEPASPITSAARTSSISPSSSGSPPGIAASLFAAGAHQEYVANQVGHEDVTTTNRTYRYVLQRRRRVRSGAVASWRCPSPPHKCGGPKISRVARTRDEAAGLGLPVSLAPESRARSR